VTTSRLTSFTDGVIAIIITIMVLELPVPHAPGMAALQPVSVLFAAYALSFVKVGIYWSQHHNVLQASKRVNGQVLLANLFFLFWLSLIPFVVRCTLSFALLLGALLGANDQDAPIVRAARRGRKGPITILAYLIAIAMTFRWPLAGVAIYIAVACMWLVPDKRFESLID
jgi:uncharacterized membrane protein